MLRQVSFAPGEIYHYYNRGTDKRVIFLDERDRQRFLLLLFFTNGTNPVHLSNLSHQGESLILSRTLLDKFGSEKGERIVDIGAYCLMPNHFHIMAKERKEGGTTLFMRKLMTGYAMYFNKKYERTGSLFEGPFKSKHVDEEGYLNWLFSYIHLNPVKFIAPEWKEKGIADPVAAEKFIDAYRYSSYHDYFIGERPESAILSKNEFPESFNDLNDFADLIKEWGENREGNF